MDKNYIVLFIFKKARIGLLNKGGNTVNVDNWRPILICSVVRRIFFKYLKRLKRSIKFDPAQQGFTISPVVSSILNSVILSVKKCRKDCFILFLDVKKSYTP